MEFFDKVCVILSELSGIEMICLEHELQSDLGLDSLFLQKPHNCCLLRTDALC